VGESLMSSHRLEKYGYVLGRFQPIHLGHIEYLEAARERCEQLVIGVTNPDRATTHFRSADPRRSDEASNPFSYFDRAEMIFVSLVAMGWDPASFVVVPSPITEPERLSAYMPPLDSTTCFLTIYDDWGREKERELRQLGYRTAVLWERSMADRLTSGTYIRKALSSGDPWRDLVPDAIVPHLERHADSSTDDVG
jgi:cytidyltransferase-like protein